MVITDITQPDADSGVYPVLLSFPRKRESAVCHRFLLPQEWQGS